MIKKISKYLLLLIVIFQVMPFCKGMVEKKKRERERTDFGPYFKMLDPELQVEIFKFKLEKAFDESPTVKEFERNIVTLSLANKSFYDLINNYLPLKEFINFLRDKKMIQTDPIKANLTFIQAAAENNLDKVNLLLKAGFDLKNQDAARETALIVPAARHDSIEMVKLLLIGGANINGKNN